MSTEILGYIGQVQEAPQTNENAPQQVRKVNKDKLYYIKQKLVGVALIALGAASVPVEGDGTAFVMMLFIGLALIATRDKVLMIGEDNDD